MYLMHPMYLMHLLHPMHPISRTTVRLYSKLSTLNSQL